MLRFLKRTVYCAWIALAIIIASALALAEGSSDLVYGATGDAIRAMQDRLIELKYFSGESTGYFGDNTRTAVKNFQIANNLEATGVVDAETIARMKSEDAVSKSEYLAYMSSVSGNKSDVLLQLGSEGEEVFAVQKLLISLGYVTGEPSGRYGRVTQEAVAAFQKANRLKETGSVDVATYELMRSGNALSRQEAAARANQEEKEEEKETAFLAPGDTGENVAILQNYLAEYGYYKGETDSVYSAEVEAAVRAFQRENALSETGKVDIEMRTLLIDGDVAYESEYEKQLSVQQVEFGDNGIAVKLLQKRLKELGYYSGKIDGIFSTGTQTAVTLFQKVHDIEMTGVADPVTRGWINSENAVPYLAVKGNMEEIPVFKYGMISDDIVTLQSYLYGLGYYYDALDGIFGSNMLAAVKKFQIANGMEATGEVDEDTRIAIMSNTAISCQQYDQLLSMIGADAGAQENATDEEGVRAARVEFVCHMALEELNKPYEYGAMGPDSYDCAGFVKYLYGRIGVSLARSCEKQGYVNTRRITENNLERGDLVFFNTKSDDDLCDEVGIYLGDGWFIHASAREGKVVISPMEEGYYAEKYSWGIRPIR